MRKSALLMLPPDQAAERVARDADATWARAFLKQLESKLETEPGERDLERFMQTWDVPAAGVARIFGVTRQAVAKWRRHGVPADRASAVADLGAATDVLLRYVRPERIPAVVRRPADLLGGRSLVELVEAGDTESVRLNVAAMVDLRRVAP